jgi:hypothetical protein
MTSLGSHINSLNFSTQLDVVKNLIGSDSAHTTTTFWGKRIVEVDGFTGSVCLDDIARKILSTSHERCNADDLKTAERISGIDIVKKLQKFYHDTDFEIQNANPVTKLFNFIVEFSNTLYTLNPAKDLREGIADKNFRTYSTNKFFQQFRTNDYVNHPGIEGGDSFPHPQKLYVKEDHIRRLPV